MIKKKKKLFELFQCLFVKYQIHSGMLIEILLQHLIKIIKSIQLLSLIWSFKNLYTNGQCVLYTFKMHYIIINLDV